MRAPSLTATRLTLLVVAVTSIVVGLLAMHTMTLSPSEDDHAAMTSAATTAAHMGTAPVTATSTLTTSPTLTATPTLDGEPAGGDCGTDCMAMQMACALGILIVALMCLRRPMSSGMVWASLATPARILVPAGIPQVRAPSLDVLCISRT